MDMFNKFVAQLGMQINITTLQVVQQAQNHIFLAKSNNTKISPVIHDHFTTILSTLHKNLLTFDDKSSKYSTHKTINGKQIKQFLLYANCFEVCTPSHPHLAAPSLGY